MVWQEGDNLLQADVLVHDTSGQNQLDSQQHITTNIGQAIGVNGNIAVTGNIGQAVTVTGNIGQAVAAAVSTTSNNTGITYQQTLLPLTSLDNVTAAVTALVPSIDSSKCNSFFVNLKKIVYLA